jgi:hypothetical protein
MGRVIDFLLGTKPRVGVEYFSGDEDVGRVLEESDINNGVVAIRYKHVNDSYLTFRGFHLTYGLGCNELRERFNKKDPSNEETA